MFKVKRAGNIVQILVVTTNFYDGGEDFYFKANHEIVNEASLLNSKSYIYIYIYIYILKQLRGMVACLNQTKHL